MKKRLFIGLILGLSFLTVNCAKNMACSYSSDTMCFEKANVDLFGQLAFNSRCSSVSGTDLTTGVCPAGAVGQCVTQSIPGVADVTLKAYNAANAVIIQVSCTVL